MHFLKKHVKTIKYSLIVAIILALLVCVAWKILTIQPIYYPFTPRNAVLLYNTSETILPLGDGYHVEEFKMSNSDFQIILKNNEGTGLWLKTPIKNKVKIQAFEDFLTSFNDPKIHEIDKKHLLSKENVYIEYEYIDPSLAGIENVFDSASIWIYDSSEERLYHIEAST